MFRRTATALAWFSTFLLMSGAAVLAQSSLAVLVVGDDGDVETVPRSSDYFDSLLQGLSNVVEARGYEVVRESDIDAGRLDEGRVSLRPPELVDLAQQSEDPPIDIVTAIQVYARAVEDPQSSDIILQMNVSGRMLEVPSRRQVGQYQIDVAAGDLPPMPSDCADACRVTFLQEQFETVGSDVGRQLAVRLDLIAR